MKATATGSVGVGALLIAILLSGPGHANEPADSGWREITVPQPSADDADAVQQEPGFHWYRCAVQIPDNWANRWELTLSLEQLADAYEVYFNGERVTAVGGFPPNYEDASDEAHRHTIPAELVNRGERNVLALRVYHKEGVGGFLGKAPAMTDYNREIVLDGPWQYRPGDDASWAEADADDDALPLFDEVVAATQVRSAPSRYEPGPSLEPAASLAAMQVEDGLALDQVLAEPTITQPLHMSFDERGRLWVVEYRQYPYPAGLRMVSRDIYWRAVWEPDLPPPPYDDDSPFRGRDRISVHEDTDGDGEYDSHKVFLDGLNITTAVAQDKDGVWVLSPPHLLFYPTDEDGTTPTGEPEVHLEGFGLEDTHSVVNSLRWGPDGWLYAAQGSTVSAAVQRPGTDDAPMRSTGQNIWRYHPETKQYEVFAEGGGNAFGVEIDAKGRTFSGHNGGDTRGFHYVQGGYLQKSFGKHGDFSNPYTFGYLTPMAHAPVPRFTHTFIINEADGLGESYRGKLLGVEPLQGRIVQSRISPTGATFATEDLSRPIKSDDPAFRPVDIKLGPDGTVYIADFYSAYIAHGENYEGMLNREAGRIYRLRDADRSPQQINLADLTTDELIDRLHDDNRWVRQTALRLLGERDDDDALPRLKKMLANEDDQAALEALWALNLTGGFDAEQATVGLAHNDPHVRRWTVRLLGDDRQVTEQQARQLADLAADEPEAVVRSQLASTAARLPAEPGLAIVRNLVNHEADRDDPYLPLQIWWAIETHCGPDGRDVVLNLFEDSAMWEAPLVVDHLLDRVMRRFAATGRRADLLACARLLELAPEPAHREKLVAGLEAAFENQTMASLPERLTEAMASADVSSRVLLVRQGDEQAVAEAISIVADTSAERQQRVRYARLLGQVNAPQSVDVLLEVAAEADAVELQRAALASLQTYGDPEIGKQVAAMHDALPADVQPAAQTLLASRADWAAAWLEAIDAGQNDADAVPAEIVAALRLHEQEPVATLVDKHFDRPTSTDGEHVQQNLDAIEQAIAAGDGDPYPGRRIYLARCGTCHQMFDEGGRVGPDLTSYQRDDTDALLRAILEPNADIREGYEGLVVQTESGRTVTGFLTDEDDDVLVVRGLDGQAVTLQRDEITLRQPLGRSLMPEGLLTGLTEQQLRDLFAYLRVAQPIE